ncbi:MAG: 50S ribosomal protein L18a [Candidatus Thorarchaeota archaeon]|nr:MAG: 50S ribosomal protein L18a [Candidatus Thorarchaeota archaeon]
MDKKVWRASGEYKKGKMKKTFVREMLAAKEAMVRERILSELGSRHRVRRKDIVITEIMEIKPEDAKSLEIRRFLGIESEIG